MSEEDSGLPEESQNILEQENAVLVEAVGPYFKFDVSSRQIFENIDDLYEYGTDIVYGKGQESRAQQTLFIVVDNADQADLLYPNQPHYWIAERLSPSFEDIGDDENFRGDVFFTPFYKKMVEFAEEGRRGIQPPANSIIAGNYRNVPVYLPNPTLDYRRPISQTDSTTGAATGTTVRTTTIVTPGAAGGVTQSETISAKISNVPLTAKERESNLVNPNLSDAVKEISRVAEVAQRQANAAAAGLTAANVTTGTDPCLPNNPPISQRAGSGATPPAAVPYDDAILRQARAAAAAPASTVPRAGGGRGNSAAEAQRQANTAATVTAPTTVTQQLSTPTSSATASTKPPNVYIYEPLTPGFDRYDFNSGKKVYTPDSGPSRNTSSQPVVQQSVPRTSPVANQNLR